MANIVLVPFVGDNLTQTITLEGTSGQTFSVSFTGTDATKFHANPANGTIGEEGTYDVEISFDGVEATDQEQPISATMSYTVNETTNTYEIDFAVPAASNPSGSEEPGGDTPGGTTPGGDTPGGTTPGGDPTSDPEEEETEEKEEVNDFFSRKDVTGEVIRVFEEDYWPVDFVNVEPDKFAIMPGEGVELDCMFGDASIPAAETTTEPEGSGSGD